MDRLESMTMLVAAAEAGSLSAASRRLGVPLATVSRKVSELEAHLRTRLFIRSSRQLTPTDAGRAYLVACKRILEEIAEAERNATGEYSVPKGELTLTAPTVFGRSHVLPVVSEFLQVFPEIDVRLLLSDRVANLLDESIDVAIRSGELPDSSLVAARIGTIQRVVCGSPAYFAKRGSPRRPADLAHHDCIAFETPSSPRQWAFKGAKKKESIDLRFRLTVNTADAAVDAAIAGLGVARVLSYQVASAERAGSLVRVLRAFESDPTPIHLVYTGQALVPLKVRAFLDFSAPRLKAALSRAKSS